MDNLPGDAARLRIYIGENDEHEDRPLAQALVLKAREMGIAGATALRGLHGYGQPAHSREAELLLARDRPIVVEVVDYHDKVEAYRAAVDRMVGSGLVTLETIRVLRYGAAPQG
jgi:PII-like signaling protein